MNQSIEYRSPFARWDDRATVRRSDGQITLEAGKLPFPPEFLPELTDPRLAKWLKPEVVHRLLANELRAYMWFTVQLEVEIVNKVAMALAFGHAHGVPLESDIAADARFIYTDEAYHAQLSAELMARARRFSGSVQPPEPAFLQSLRHELALLPASERFLGLFLFVVVSETLISRKLATIPNDERVMTGVRDVVRNHARDEALHHKYFAEAFARIWPRLPSDVKERMGQTLIRYLSAFLKRDWNAASSSLASECDSPTVVTEVFMDYSQRHNSVDPWSAAPSLALFHRVGVLEHAAVQDELHRIGLSDLWVSTKASI